MGSFEDGLYPRVPSEKKRACVLQVERICTTRPSASDPQVVQLVANRSMFVESKWVQIHNAGYEYVAGGPYGNGDRPRTGSIGKFPMEALLVGEDQLHCWNLQPYHKLAEQAWKLTSPKR